MDRGKRKTTPMQQCLNRHMSQWRESIDGSRALKWGHWKYGIQPAYRDLAETMVRTNSVKLSTQIELLPSSQIFAFNLFLPFWKGGRELLSKHMSEIVGTQLTIDEVRFEWVPPPRVLREPGGQYVTAVDVVLWGRLENGGRAVVLVEVKLSEEEFSHCKGRTSDKNDRLDVCDSAKLFLDDPSACYLIRSARAKPGHYRRYWEIFAESHGGVRDAFPNADLGGPCPFAYDMQQPMRNLAIARGLEQLDPEDEDRVEKAWFALCAHDENPDIAKHWVGWKGLLPDPSMAPLLPASEVICIGEAEGLTEWAAYMRKRYFLKESS